MNRPPSWLYGVVFAMAVVAATSLIPLLRRFAIAQGLSDIPSERKAHPEPVALLGGVGIFAAAGVALWLVVPAAARTLKGVLLAGLVILVIGLQDDVQGMDPWLKLVGQVTAALVLVGSGVSASVTKIGLLDASLTVAWIVVVVNAVNLSDNMDGLAAGLTGVACGSFFALAVSFDQYLVATLAAALAGGALGFLFYNYPPAKIFMGDAGSHILGFLVAVMGLLLKFPTVKKPVGLAIPALVLIVPLLDTVLVAISRLRRGVPVTQGGTDHASHRLVEWGLDRRKAIGVLWGCGAVGGIGAFVASRLSGWWGVVPIAVCFLLGAAGVALLEARGAPSRPVFDRDDTRGTATAS
ncbi:MAG: undecaprenyl/decaprenyl-phosphate alpha-N-acetylglucosaminyl 1-phosphate transferase [Acidimicrobiia bacterium]